MGVADPVAGVVWLLAFRVAPNVDVGGLVTGLWILVAGAESGGTECSCSVFCCTEACWC